MILQQAPPDGAVGRFLQTFGVPYADAVGSAITFLVAFVVLYFVGRAVVQPIVGRMLERRNVEYHARQPLLKLTKAGIFFAAVAIAFGLAGYGSFLTSLATIGAAATLVVGLAMQDVLANFVAGVFIYTDRPFKLGDWIQWDDHEGIVEDISLRVTRVRTFDNELLTVPNSQLTGGVITNPTAKDKLRVQFLFGVSYDDDIDEATEIIVEEADEHEDILDDPGVSVRLTELGDSFVGLKSRFWIDDPSRSDFVKTRGEYVQRVKERFDEAGIDIPYPTRTLEGELQVGEGDVLVEE